MRQQPSGRRPRGRSNRKHFTPHRSQTFDSHGPDVRVRGNAMQVYEKYVNLARDAAASGDRIVAESYQQYAEHYYRIINDTTDPQRPSAERPASERPDGDRGPQERAAPERQDASGQPYPVDAEQPFVDGATVKAAPAGNGQAPAAKPEAAKQSSAGEGESPPTAVDPGESPDVGAAEAPPAGESKPKTRGRGRPRTRAKAGNGAAGKADGEESGASPSGGPSEAGEPTG
jgi:hypothetical protein